MTCNIFRFLLKGSIPFSISSSNVYAQPCAFGYIEMVFSVGSEKNAITFLESNKTFPTLWLDRNLKDPKSTVLSKSVI